MTTTPTPTTIARAELVRPPFELRFKLRDGDTIDFLNRKHWQHKAELAWDLTTSYPEPRVLLRYDDEFDGPRWGDRGPITVVETERCGICFVMQQYDGHWTIVENVPYDAVRRTADGKVPPSEYRRAASEEYLRLINGAKELYGEDYWDELEDVWW